MKLYINFQNFEMDSTNSFLNVATSKELKEWKKLLRAYYYLRNAGLKVSKSNRKAMLEALHELKITQKELSIMIDNGKTAEEREDHVNAVVNLQDFMQELSLISDKIIEKGEPTIGLKTMMYFDSIHEDEDGFITYKTKKGKKFTMQDSTNYYNHKKLIEKYLTAIEDRKKAEKKSLKKSTDMVDKAQKKSDNFTEKVNEKKRKS